jgi:hypothetical protein
MGGFSLLYSFPKNCDGPNNPCPVGDLLFDGDGHLYGVTQGDEESCFGTVYQLTVP